MKTAKMMNDRTLNRNKFSFAVCRPLQEDYMQFRCWPCSEFDALLPQLEPSDMQLK